MTWMTGAIWCFFQGLKNLGFHKVQRFISTLVFIIFTTLPWLEGHIPNGELFVIGFICVSFWILSYTKVIHQYFSLNQPNAPLKTVWKFNDSQLFFFSGIFASLAILTKVPAIFDVAGVMVTFLIVLWSQSFSVKSGISTIKQLLIMILGVVVPIVISWLYFYVRGAGKEYIDFALLYNFHYAGNWIPRSLIQS